MSRLISKVLIRNFKSIGDANVDLADLTVLVGENSAGKSSLLQAIFMMAEIVEGSGDPRFVSLNGPEQQLGGFSNILHAGSGGPVAETVEVELWLPIGNRRPGFLAMRNMRFDRNSGFSFPLRPTPAERPFGSNAWSLELSAGPDDQAGVARIAGATLRSDVWPGEHDGPDRAFEGDARFTAIPVTQPPSAQEAWERGRRIAVVDFVARRGMRSEEIPQFRGEGFVRLLDADGAAQADVEEFEFPVVTVASGIPVAAYGDADMFGLAEMWLREIMDRGWRDGARRVVNRPGRKQGIDDGRGWGALSGAEIAREIQGSFRQWLGLGSDGPRQIRSHVSETNLPRLNEVWVDVVNALGRMLSAETKDIEILMPRTDGGAHNGMTSALELGRGVASALSGSVHYLGPLRVGPLAFYQGGQQGRIATLGMMGELTVSTLHNRRNEKVVFRADGQQGQAAPLGEAVDYWLERFQVASSIATSEVGRAGISVDIRDRQSGATRDLAEVGVGVSQILPVIVLCLLAEPGDLVMLEQPELHLHPAPQQVLGDFLIEMSRSGRQLLVETHSEYLINRLRLRKVQDENGDLEGSVGIYYVTRRDGMSSFEPMVIDELGSFDQWPEGFFDQTTTEAEEILRSAIRRRRRKES